MALSLYIDEDSMRRGLVNAMRRAGIDVLTVSEAGNRSRSDAFHLRTASALGRAVYTQNVRDYAVLHEQMMREGASHAGVVLLTNQRLSIGEQVSALQRLEALLGPESLANRVWYLLNYR